MSIILYDGRRLHRGLFDGQPTLIQYNVSRKEVEQSQFDRLREMLSSFAEIGATARGSLLFCFNGWDFDERSLAEIPEVSAYIKQVLIEFPFLWYFTRIDYSQHLFVALCPCTMVSSPLFGKIADMPQGERRMVQLDIDAAERLFADITGAVLSYGVLVGDLPGAREVLREWRETLNL